MGVFSGPQGTPAPRPAARGMTLPAQVSELLAAQRGTDFAAVNGNSLQALRSVAIGSSIGLITSLVSELPGAVYSSRDARKPLRTPGNLEDPGGDGHGREDWVAQLLGSFLYRGNVYGQEVTWDRYGSPRQVSLFFPDSVGCRIVEGRPAWTVNGVPFTELSQWFHRRAWPMAGVLLGQSPIERHAGTIDATLAAQLFGVGFFKDGGHPSGLLINSAELEDAQAKSAKDKLMGILRGKREPVVLGAGWTWQQLSVSPNESQFLETQAYSEAQCCRIYGPGLAEIFGYETGGSLTYATTRDRRADLYTFTLSQWIRRAERVLSALLPAPQVWRADRDAVLEATTLDRLQARNLSAAWMLIDEIRAAEGLPPLPDGKGQVLAKGGASVAAPDPAADPTADNNPEGGTDGNPAGA